MKTGYFFDHLNKMAEHPDDAKALNGLAWLLVVRPDNLNRNYQRAIQLSQQAVEIDSKPAYWDTMACAYAGAGRFDWAIDLANQHGLDSRKALFKQRMLCQ